jgi:hypothetical protein
MTFTRALLTGIAVGLAVCVCLFAGSCGKSKGVMPAVSMQQTGKTNLVSWNGRHVKPLNELLAELDSQQMPSGVNPQEWAVLKSEMRTWLNETFGEKKKTLKIPDGDPPNPTPDYVKARDLSWAPETGNTWGKLTWRYVNDGDYNQDGNVGVSEITPLAMHLNEAVTEDNSIQELIDEDDSLGVNGTNGNGVVDYDPEGTNDDVTTILRCFAVLNETAAATYW